MLLFIVFNYMKRMYQAISHSEFTLSRIVYQLYHVGDDCEKIRTMFIFHAISENTAYVR